jgi:hypothetical protein
VHVRGLLLGRLDLALGRSEQLVGKVDQRTRGGDLLPDERDIPILRVTSRPSPAVVVPAGDVEQGVGTRVSIVFREDDLQIPDEVVSHRWLLSLHVVRFERRAAIADTARPLVARGLGPEVRLVTFDPWTSISQAI